MRVHLTKKIPLLEKYEQAKQNYTKIKSELLSDVKTKRYSKIDVIMALDALNAMGEIKKANKQWRSFIPESLLGQSITEGIVYNTIKFGKYGDSPIEWYVIEKSKNQLKMVTLDVYGSNQSYHGASLFCSNFDMMFNLEEKKLLNGKGMLSKRDVEYMAERMVSCKARNGRGWWLCSSSDNNEFRRKAGHDAVGFEGHIVDSLKDEGYGWAGSRPSIILDLS